MRKGWVVVPSAATPCCAARVAASLPFPPIAGEDEPTDNPWIVGEPATRLRVSTRCSRPTQGSLARGHARIPQSIVRQASWWTVREPGRWPGSARPGTRTGQRPVSLVVATRQRGDSPQFVGVLTGIRVPRVGAGRPRTRPDRVPADKAYSSAPTGRCCGIRAVIPEKDDQAAHRRGRASGAAGRRVRPGGLPAAARGGVRHQPAQAAPGGALPSHHTHRRHQRVAMTSTTHPSRLARRFRRRWVVVVGGVGWR
jgi:hypothetical protein